MSLLNLHHLSIRPQYGWGGRIRTCECRDQNPVPYHLATPHQLTNTHKTNFKVFLKPAPERAAIVLLAQLTVKHIHSINQELKSPNG